MYEVKVTLTWTDSPTTRREEYNNLLVAAIKLHASSCELVIRETLINHAPSGPIEG